MHVWTGMKLCYRNNRRSQNRVLSISFLALASLFFSVAQAQHAQSHISTIRPQSSDNASLNRLANAPAAPTFLANRPDINAKPATVLFTEGLLTVRANNSDLTQILDDVSRQSGMVIEGSVREARVYGVYGPGNASSILSELLEGMGCNVMIVGGADGSAPKQLILSNRTGGPTPPSSSNAVKALDDVQKNSQQRDDEPQFGPGAIAHPAPAPSEDPHVRVEQNMQRLQQMRDLLTKPATPR